ncbi:methyltransferase domain-containing protein [Streptomyces sp. NPDC006649]|uniref:methyltransferase domain-containing protein n=1 Tax=unclassified Streptomyces TaxID=2593676 RepID=UPI002F913700
MTSTMPAHDAAVPGGPPGYVTFEELRVDRPGTADELTSVLAAEVHAWVRHLDGFVSARIHLSLDGTSVVNRVEWSSERAFLDSFTRGPADSPLRSLSDRPGVLSLTSFGGTPAPGVEGPAATEPPGIMSVAKRRVAGHESARALAGLLQESGDWKRRHPGFISAQPCISLDGTTYVNYPQWVSEDAFRSYMADPRNAAGQEAIAALETGPPEFVMCTLVAQIDAAARPGPSYSTGSLTAGAVSALDQVRLFEKKYDPASTAILEGLPVGRDWRCLELGAGAGSVAHWLADRADRGSVLAVDIDTQHLDAGRSRTLTVQQADVMDLECAPGSFDLIFSRAVFEHLKDPEELLDRVLGWLAPGGWLVIEDFYYLPGADSPTAVGRSLVAAYVRHMEEQGADMRWGRRLAATLARKGLDEVGTRVTPAGPGQSAVDNELIGLRMRQEGHTLVESGQVTADELAEFLGLLGTPQGRDMTTLLVSAWGRRPTP